MTMWNFYGSTAMSDAARKGQSETMSLERLASSLRARLENDMAPSVAECHVKARKNILPSKEIKSDAKTRRKTDVGMQSNRSNLDGKTMDIHGNQAAVSNGHKDFFSLEVVQPQSRGVIQSEDREKSAGIDIGLGPDPACRAFHSQRYDGARNATIVFVREYYRAHRKSCGRGTGNPVGIVPGCFRRASSKRRPALFPMNNSPAATTAYWPAYLSTSSSKCRRIHSSSVRGFLAGLRFAREALMQ
jgi:hypothetical protein